MAQPLPDRLHHGRGAVSNPTSARMRTLAREAEPDRWDEEEPPPLATSVTVEQPRTIISRNSSPDIPFDRSINAYRGCEHGCIYCFARPTHAYHDLSPGLDFETRLFAKPDAARLLAAELGRRGYTPAPIAMGTNTDPYQPIERQWRITRQLLEVLAAWGHPATITTKSHLVTRDIDILAPMAARRLVSVNISITTLDPRLARAMEPRAATPRRRLDAIRALSDAGIPTSVFVSPIIPALNDHEIERILSAAAEAGARGAASIPLRLPHEVRGLFEDWLAKTYPDRARHVMTLQHDIRGGRANDPRFGERMRGSGPYAEAIRARFSAACRRLGLDRAPAPLALDQFHCPDCPQLELF
ncbi:PA0069 family radical SAM protein [Parapedomonas caeni]